MILRAPATTAVRNFITTPQVYVDIGGPFSSHSLSVGELLFFVYVCSELNPPDCGIVNCLTKPPVKFHWLSFNFELTVIFLYAVYVAIKCMVICCLL